MTAQKQKLPFVKEPSVYVSYLDQFRSLIEVILTVLPSSMALIISGLMSLPLLEVTLFPLMKRRIPLAEEPYFLVAR